METETIFRISVATIAAGAAVISVTLAVALGCMFIGLAGVMLSALTILSMVFDDC